MKFEITQEAMSVVLLILIATSGVMFVKGCWDYKTAIKVEEMRAGR